MSHLDEVIARVDAAIEESVIAHMNELLISEEIQQQMKELGVEMEIVPCAPGTPILIVSAACTGAVMAMMAIPARAAFIHARAIKKPPPHS